MDTDELTSVTPTPTIQTVVMPDPTSVQCSTQIQGDCLCPSTLVYTPCGYYSVMHIHCVHDVTVLLYNPTCSSRVDHQ